MPNLTLVYFDLPGRAEAIRLALVLGDVPFTDERIPLSDQSTKEQSPSERLPMLKIGGRTYSESVAILNYAGYLAGMAPKDAEAQLRVDMLVEITQDLFGPWVAVMFASEETKAKVLEESTAKISAKLRILNDMVGETQRDGHAVGGTLSVADLAIYLWIKTLRAQGGGLVISELDQYEALEAVYKNISEMPEVLKYYASKQ